MKNSRWLPSLHSPTRRKTTTLNMDRKVGMTTPTSAPSFRAGRCSCARPGGRGGAPEGPGPGPAARR